MPHNKKGLNASATMWLHYSGAITDTRPDRPWEYNEYIRKDLHDALAAERDALKAQRDNIVCALQESIARAEKAEDERDQLAEQYTTACRTIDKLADERDQYREAATRHRNEVQRLLHDVIEPLKAERDQALAQRPAGAAGWIAGRDKAADYMADRANGCPIFETASVYQVHSNSIRTLPLDPDAEAALKRHDAALIERCADAAEDYCSDMPDLAGHGHSIGIKEAIRALARPTEGE